MQLVKGDPGMEDIYKWTQKQINTPFRGRTGMPFLPPTSAVIALCFLVRAWQGMPYPWSRHWDPLG